MPTDLPRKRPDIFLAFGKVASPATALAMEGREIAAAADRSGGLGRQVALIGPATDAFRLNSLGWLSAPSSLIAALVERQDLRLLCRDRLRGLSPPFAARVSRWIDAYLDRAEAAAGPAPARAEVAEVTDASDRFFAALLPLPGCKIMPVDLHDGGPLPRPGHPFVAVDMAFWNGRTLTGLLFGSAFSRTPRHRRDLDALAELIGPRLTLVTADDEETAEAALNDVLGEMHRAPPPWFGPCRAEEFRAPLP